MKQLSFLLLLFFISWSYCKGSPSGLTPEEKRTYIEKSDEIQFDRKIDKTQFPRPSFTPKLRLLTKGENLDLQVIARFYVDSSGKVREVDILKTLAPKKYPVDFTKQFETNTKQSIYRWRFPTSTLQGKPVNWHEDIPVEYKIRGGW